MIRDRVRRTLIAYDIPDDRRRTRVAKAIGQYGDRIQYSVFIVDILPAALTRLKAEVSQLIDTGEDSVLVCDLGLRAALTDMEFSYLGQSRDVTEAGPLIV
ncbi:MAG: CRISPR-associated endonuclease Cas2 [Dermabacter sp.]|nr:CRISPR-associated endonuclease Cas2 [Dermabacter sp.]